jgi:hypothetical protein
MAGSATGGGPEHSPGHPGQAPPTPSRSSATPPDAGDGAAGTPPAGGPANGGLTESERAELTRLRAEVATLQASPAPRRRRVSWRTPVASLLIILGCLLAPVSVLAVWTANQVSDTSRYIANIEPLVHDPAVQNALTDKVTFQIMSHLDVTGNANAAADILTSKGMPRVGTLLRTFAPSLNSAVAGFVHSTVHKIVTGPRFASAWVQVNTVAHEQLVLALSGQGGGAVRTSNGQVTIDLAPFIAIVKKDLSARGFTLVNSLPPIHPTLALFSAKKLVQAQTAYRLINDLKIVLPILSLLLIALGVYIARGHRRALIGAGLGFAASMLVLGAGLMIFRGVYLNTVPASLLPADAAAAMFDTLVRFIREGLRLLLVIGLVVAAGAFLTGPSVTAVRTRHGIVSALSWVRSSGERAGLHTGPAGRWTYAHRRGLRITAVALAAVVFVFWGEPSAAVVITIVVLLLVVLGLIELIGRPPSSPQPAGQPSGG